MNCCKISVGRRVGDIRKAEFELLRCHDTSALYYYI